MMEDGLIQDKEMNVLLSAYACRPNAGTEPGIGWNWAVSLAEVCFSLHVLTAGRNREAVEAHLRDFPCPKLHFHFIDVQGMDPMAAGAKHYLKWQWMAFRTAKELSKQVAFSVIQHVSYGSVHIPTPLCWLGPPTIFGPVGGGQTTYPSLLPYFGSQAGRERNRTRLTKLLPWLPPYRIAMQKMGAVLAANQDTLQLAKRSGCGRVELMCDTGVRSDFGSERPRQFESSASLHLLWVGRFLARKGVELALDALQMAAPHISLTLVGDGMSEARMRLMIAERGLDGRVRWAGKRLPWLEVREAYLTHDALLFTSLRDSFGSQILEAMSLGLPVIALDQSGARDFIPAGAGLKVKVEATVAEMVKTLASAMDRFATLTPDERTAMSQVAWKGAREFTWQARAASAVRLYKDLLHQKNTSVQL